MDTANGRFSPPGMKFAASPEDDIEPAATPVHFYYVDSLVKRARRFVKIAEPDASQRQITEHYRLRLGVVLKQWRGFVKEASCAPGVVQEEIARSRHPAEETRRKKTAGCIITAQAAELRVGILQRPLTRH
jgi:hypothetical protein